MPTTTAERPNPLHLLIAFGSGGILTLMVLLNGQLGFYGTPLFSSWTAHGTGTLAAALMIAVLYRWRRPGTPEAPAEKAPLWAYLGGIAGAVTVMLTSTTVNSSLALSGTLALGLAGQVVFSLSADHWGLFGLPKRRPGARDLAALGLIVAGSALIILFGRAAA
ncbi:MAG: DMT family transporter [Alphaproteobacteria bacterium]|jgi:bacterial/archaeal transporter family-2 protein|nr:DMT family transporter [Alphaproteobacteria bacterium]